VTALAPDGLVRPIVRVIGLALFAGGLTALLALAYRWYTRERLPVGLALLAGLGTVAVYLNTTAALGTVIGGSDGLLDLDVAVQNVATFALTSLVAVGGSRLGHRLAGVVSVASGTREFDAEVGRVVTAVGRAIAVELPEEIEDIEGYDPVPAETKAAIAGKTLLFPRRLTVGELRDRIVTRLKEDHGVGRVNLDLAADGTVSTLALGSRAAGIGPTLAPGTVATAIRADPPFSAGSGDVVQVWRGGDTPVRVATATVRAKQGEIVTIALDAADAGKLDTTERYRLVTLPAERRVDREFAGLLRAAEETFDVTTIGAGSSLVGIPVGALDTTAIAVRPAGGTIEAIPPRDRRLAAGDTVYVIAGPESIRRLEAAATGVSETP
jgi:hypothetical protein